MVHHLTGHWSFWTLAGDILIALSVFTVASYVMVKWLMSEPVFGKPKDKTSSPEKN